MPKRILFVHSKPGENFCSLLQFHQILKTKYLDTFMFVQTSGPSKHFEEAVEIFDEVRSFKVLVVEVDQNPRVFIDKKLKVFEIIDRKKSKKLVIISADDSLCPNDPSVDYTEDKHYKLDDLDDDSKNKLLTKTITFQDKQVPIGSIIPYSITSSIPLIDVFNCESIGQNIISNDVYKTSKSFYIERQLKGPNAVICEKDFLDLSETVQDFLIVVNSAGMGKTSLLNHLAENIKNSYTDHWIINIALNNHTKYFEQNLSPTPKSIADFILQDFLKLESSFAELLFRESFLKIGNVQIILDGLDEIAPIYTDAVMNLMKTLQSLRIRKIIISTRPELGDRLETEFNKKRFEILPFTRKEQETFLMSSWKGNSKNSEIELQKFSSKLLDSITQTVADEEFTGTPLTTKLVAEIYKSQAQRGIESDKIEGATNLYELFKKLLEEKIKIICGEKMGAETTKVQAQLTMINERKCLFGICEKLSLPNLFSSEELKLFPLTDYMKIDKNEFLMVLKYGLITGQLGSEKFIHKTIAEFFALLYLIKHLNHEEIFLFFVRVVLLEKRFQVIRKMFDSSMKDPSEEFRFSSHITHFSLASSMAYDFSSALCVACNEGNSKTAKILFLFLIDVSDPQELSKFQQSFIDKNSTTAPYLFTTEEFDFLGKTNEKFGIDFVKEIVQTKFDKGNATQADLLSFVLFSGRKLGNILKFFRENSLLDSEFIEYCFFKADRSGSNFVQKVLNSKTSKQKIEACKELVEIQKTGKVISAAISNHFQDHFMNSDPENSLLLDALKVGDFEAFKLFLDFVDDLSIFPKLLSKLFQFYLSKFGDQFNVLQLLRESLSPGTVKSNQFESCFESIKILVDHFPEDSRSLLEALLVRNESGGNFLAAILNPSTTEDQFNFHIRSLQDIKKLLDFQIFSGS
jgi:hypothetical protein